MPAAAIPAVALAVSAANTVAGAPAHAKTWNKTYHEVFHFDKEIDNIESKLMAYTRKFERWMQIWDCKPAEWNSYAALYLSSPDRGVPADEQRPAENQMPEGDHRLPECRGLADSHYRLLWGDHYEQMRTDFEKVIQSMRDIQEHTNRILNNRKKSPGWKRYFAVHRGPYLRNITYAFFSNWSLGDEFKKLEENIGQLNESSEWRLRSMRGDAVDLRLSESVVLRLERLEYFGRTIVQQLRNALPPASAWSLELCHPDIGGSATKWECLTSIKLWLSYSSPVVEQHDEFRQRIILEYCLDHDPDPPNWASLLRDANSLGDLPQDVAYNPRLIRQFPGTSKLTVPFSNLIRTWNADESLLVQLWARDQACLVLSLANWSLLLWTSDWTAQWCSSGIRFVQVATDVGEIGKNSSFFPSFSRCGSERPSPAINQGQHDHSDCSHSEMKLCNLGLVLAEAICITPLRVSISFPGMYEKFVKGEWQPMDEECLLDMVDDKAMRSMGVRDAIQHCLRSKDNFQSTRGRLGGFFSQYVEIVFNPIKEWCHVQQETYAKTIEPFLPILRKHLEPCEEILAKKLYLWPDDAFDALPVEIQGAEVIAELGRHT